MIEQEMFKNMKNYIPKNFWEDLMYMGNVEDISLYKHYYTRRYINVDNHGNFYVYNGTIYDKVDKNYALKLLLS